VRNLSRLIIISLAEEGNTSDSITQTVNDIMSWYIFLLIVFGIINWFESV
jgi:hypothetical protein